MFFEPILKVLGLILAPLLSKRCQKHAKYFFAWDRLPQNFRGAAVTAVGVVDNTLI